MARSCVPELGQQRSLTTPLIGRRDLGRSMYHILSPVNTGREADHLLSIAEPIVCRGEHLGCLLVPMYPDFDLLQTALH